MPWPEGWLSNNLRARVRELAGPDKTIDRVFDWLRTVVIDSDVMLLDVPGFRGHFAFAMPILPGARPARVDRPDPARIRFVVRQRSVRRSDVEATGFRPVLRLSELEVLERDAPHGVLQHPLRLGIDAEQARVLLASARRLVAAALSNPQSEPSAAPKDWPGRFCQRCGLGLAIWTRGHLRGSVVNPPASVWRGLSNASQWVCRDRRFKALSSDDLEHSRLQVSLLHTPRVPVPRSEIDSRPPYTDKAFFVTEGASSGVYVPEIFNLRRLRTMKALSTSLATEKAGLPSFGPHTALEICQVQEFIESADLRHAIALHGPIAASRSDESLQTRATRAGIAACRWLAALQRPDGSLPLRVVPQTGRLEGDDRTRAAMTAHAAAVFGRARDCAQAVEFASGVSSWLTNTRQSSGDTQLLTTVYRGKLALALGHADAAVRAMKEARALLQCTPFEPLTFSHVASYMRIAAEGELIRCEEYDRLCGRLAAAFDSARRATESLPIALWAELVEAFPAGSVQSREAAEWLVARQLDDGAFPNTTTSDFSYTRGTGKVFEVIAANPAGTSHVIDRCLEWLLGMQYDSESMFFVPEEHRPVVEGGFRHDAFDADAWIDAAGHVLLGLARWEAT